jgi:hypothetical protein
MASYREVSTSRSLRCGLATNRPEPLSAIFMLTWQSRNGRFPERRFPPADWPGSKPPTLCRPSWKHCNTTTSARWTQRPSDRSPSSPRHDHRRAFRSQLARTDRTPRWRAGLIRPEKESPPGEGNPLSTGRSVKGTGSMGHGHIKHRVEDPAGSPDGSAWGDVAPPSRWCGGSAETEASTRISCVTVQGPQTTNTPTSQGTFVGVVATASTVAPRRSGCG